MYILPWSNELVAVEMCLWKHCIATDVSSGSTILASSLHVTVLKKSLAALVSEHYA
jgi:hypothetical protein